MIIDVLGTQDSAYFYLSIPSNLTPEGMLAHLLNSILSNLKGEITDENNQAITDENNNPITFNNIKYYPEMPLNLWRTRINGDWHEYQIVFLLKELQ